MATVHIVVDLWQPAFHGLDREGDAEWPPSPLRLAQALMAGAHRPDSDPEAQAAVKALVRLPQPVIRVPGAQQANLLKTYTHRSGAPETNAKGRVTPRNLGGFLDTTLPGLPATNLTAKPLDAQWLDDCRIVFSVADPDDTLDVVALDRAARRVPYFGRSQDGCDMSVTTDDVAGPTMELHPHEKGPTRGWQPNSCEWMDANHKRMAQGHPLPSMLREKYSMQVNYRVRVQWEPCQDSSRLQTLELKQALAGGAVPHLMAGLPTSPEVRLFPCLSVGHAHADGRVHGIGLLGHKESMPADFVAELYATGLFKDDPTGGSFALRPARWIRASPHWQSASPFRAHPDERIARHALEAELTDLLGDPPVQVQVSRMPLHRWHPRWKQPSDGLGHWWATVTLEKPITGPLFLGSSTDLGFGLFIPAQEER